MLEYTTVDRIFSKFGRELKGTDINEDDVIEMIGEALDFLKVAQIQEQAIAFLEVNNYEVEVPKGLQTVLQIARNNQYVAQTNICDEVTAITETPTVITNCCGTIVDKLDINFDINIPYGLWTNSELYHSKYTPIRLSNNLLYNSLVCKERNVALHNCNDQYNIVGVLDKKIRFSFEHGQVAIAYLKNAIDKETGYPLVPDEISCITAISYYVKWKLAEWLQWNSREGSQGIAQDNERKWLKYCRQAKNYAKMPKTIDDYQDLLEQSHALIPNHRKYYGFFGNLSTRENLRYNNTNHGQY